MSRDLSPVVVAQRLARLRDLYVPMTESEARRLHEAARDPALPFADAVALRLAELRALCELTAHLHERRARSRG